MCTYYFKVKKTVIDLTNLIKGNKILAVILDDNIQPEEDKINKYLTLSKNMDCY